LKVRGAAIRCVGNISSGDGYHCEKLMELDLLPILEENLGHQEKLFRKEAAWTISNLMAGEKEDIQEFIDYKDGKLIL